MPDHAPTSHLCAPVPGASVKPGVKHEKGSTTPNCKSLPNLWQSKRHSLPGLVPSLDHTSYPRSKIPDDPHITKRLTLLNQDRQKLWSWA